MRTGRRSFALITALLALAGCGGTQAAVTKTVTAVNSSPAPGPTAPVQTPQDAVPVLTGYRCVITDGSTTVTYLGEPSQGSCAEDAVTLSGSGAYWRQINVDGYTLATQCTLLAPEGTLVVRVGGDTYTGATSLCGQLVAAGWAEWSSLRDQPLPLSTSGSCAVEGLGVNNHLGVEVSGFSAEAACDDVAAAAAPARVNGDGSLPEIPGRTRETVCSLRYGDIARVVVRDTGLVDRGTRLCAVLTAAGWSP